MGASYEVVYFNGKYYLQMQDASTDWEEKVIELTPNQVKAASDFESYQYGAKGAFLRDLIK